ncbi:zinc ribbon domain-containing protein [Facklamia sp. 7083-14-GEN3]|uniref:zinc ribbon domain-containing protein n=1 Tax=Facklamia sp. 7083-14-GEN3 TaxID=2973478 RepID=UPI00215D39F2|nr:zinc ribbon domain-containing protein [Facklamia sp. 7083-14-GEN3]MCR8969957.1 zinc ribbon domain-containing protein [Facklamia sp. 7083-14-GEN3]
MKCLNCGHENLPDAKYCSECGLPLNNAYSNKENDSAPFDTSLDAGESKNNQEDVIVSRNRMDLYHNRQQEKAVLTDEMNDKVETVHIDNKDHRASINQGGYGWKKIIGFSLIFLGIISLFMVYRLNFSKAAVEEQFIKAIEKNDYLKAAAVVRTPITEKLWTDLDVKRTIEHYQDADIDFPYLLQKGDLSTGIQWQGNKLAKTEKMGNFMLIFPKYAINLYPFPVQLSLSNEYRDLKIVSKDQSTQSVDSKGGIQIEPRIQNVMIQYNYQGKTEEVWFDLDYSKLEEHRHKLSLVPVTNTLTVDKALLGVRPDLPFQVNSFNIDGQDYSQSQIQLSGFAGQIFEVSLKANYNGQELQTETIPVKLVNKTRITLDYSNDQKLREQIKQAELK